MSAFNYYISVTGDCSHTSAGAISLLPSGGTPPYTVEWVDPALGTDVVSVLPAFRQNLSYGTYGVRLNDSTLPVNNAFYVNIPVSSGVCASVVSIQNTTCALNNGSVTGTSNSQYSSTNFYLFSGDSSFVQSGSTNTPTIVFNNLTAGTYFMVAQDIGGCTGRSQTFIVEESTPLSFGLYVVPNSSCSNIPNGKLFVTGQTGTAPYTYLWSNSATTSSISGLSTGNYSVVVTDAYGCASTQSADIQTVPPIGLGIFTVTNPSCFQTNGVINITITGGTAPFYYSASTGEVAISYSRTYSLSGLSAGDYQFQVTDAGLCSFIAGTTLATPQGIVAVNVTTQNSTCNSTNGAISVSVVGGVVPYTYTLVYPDATQQVVSNNQTTQVYSNLESGIYTVIVQDTSGCYFIQEVFLQTYNKFTISADVTSTSCAQNNGKITIYSSTGATSPIDYMVDNVYSVMDTTLSAVTFVNMSAGTHNIIVTDADGCSQTMNVYVPASQPVDFSLYSTSCGLGDSGTLTSFISSGTPPFTFNWSSNVPSNPQQIEVSGLTAGTYTLIVTDANGCSQQRGATISCYKNYSMYETYAMGQETFAIISPTKFGLIQMLNDGFKSLTTGDTNCVLISATFTAQVEVVPAGYNISNTFFTSTSLNQAPSDNLWYNTIKPMLLSIPGVGGVTIDPLTNQIILTTIPNSDLAVGQEIKLKLQIEYDIMCLT